jgi:hypothetical protein
VLLGVSFDMSQAAFRLAVDLVRPLLLPLPGATRGTRRLGAHVFL